MGSSFIWIVQKYQADRNVGFVDHPQIWLSFSCDQYERNARVVRRQCERTPFSSHETLVHMWGSTLQS